MYRKIVQICLATILLVSAGVQAGGAPDPIYRQCVSDQSDRFAFRMQRNDCDLYATEFASYTVGIFRPRNPNDSVEGIELIPVRSKYSSGFPMVIF